MAITKIFKEGVNELQREYKDEFEFLKNNKKELDKIISDEELKDIAKAIIDEYVIEPEAMSKPADQIMVELSERLGEIHNQKAEDEYYEYTEGHDIDYDILMLIRQELILSELKDYIKQALQGVRDDDQYKKDIDRTVDADWSRGRNKSNW